MIGYGKGNYGFTLTDVLVVLVLVAATVVTISSTVPNDKINVKTTNANLKSTEAPEKASTTVSGLYISGRNLEFWVPLKPSL